MEVDIGGKWRTPGQGLVDTSRGYPGPKSKGLLRANSDRGFMERQHSPHSPLIPMRAPLAAVQEAETEEVDAPNTLLQHHGPGFGNVLHRASAPAILTGSEATSSSSMRSKKTVNFGFRYSIVIGGENFSEGRRVSEVEAQKKSQEIQRWWAERRRLGYDTYLGEARSPSGSPGPGSPELPVGRGRARSAMDFELPEPAKALEAPDPSLVPGRRRSRADFSAVDVEEVDENGLQEPSPILGHEGPSETSCKQNLQSLEDFLDSGGATSLEEFLKPVEAPADQQDKRRCWTADITEIQ
mmetsp:Transcript_36159/g.83345  ORF Transcript_36159/g.83345 Transcript_36159/m.83345 type:complete len:297 (-) Transcript_36159:7-897(-)